MPTNKYEQYILTDLGEKAKEIKTPKRILEEREKGNYIDAEWMFYLDDKLAEGAFYTNCVWIWDKKGVGDLQLEIAHTHEFDETIGLVGTVPGKPRELGGEIEFWLEDEKYMMDKSCLIFVPKGMKHLPLYLKKVEYPIFMWTAGNGSEYTRSSGDEEV